MELITGAYSLHVRMRLHLVQNGGSADSNEVTAVVLIEGVVVQFTLKSYMKVLFHSRPLSLSDLAWSASKIGPWESSEGLIPQGSHSERNGKK